MKKPTRFQIQIDPRIELLSIVLHFSEWPYYGKFEVPHPYYQAVLDHFGAFKDHEVVHWLNEAGKNWNLDDPATVMFWLSLPPEMEHIHPYPLHPTCQMSIPEFERTVDLLNQFSRDANFLDFWEANQSRYQRFEQAIQGLLPYEEHIQLMTDFYGEEKTQFRVIPAPLFDRVIFGPQLETATGTISHFITAFNSAENEEPAFSASLLRMLIFHEFGHSFVNPICEAYRAEIFAYEHLFEYLKADMSAITYPDWFPTVHEHIVRTGEYMLLEQAGYHQEAAQNYKENLRLGFALLPFFHESMVHYAQNRDHYPNFRNFFPELLKVFDHVKPQAYERSMPMGISMKPTGAYFLIKRLQEGSVMARAGFQVDDRVLAVNGLALTDDSGVHRVEDIWYGAKQGERVRFSIDRNGKLEEFFVEVPFERAYRFI